MEKDKKKKEAKDKKEIKEKKSKIPKKEKVCEIFKIEKNGEKTIKTCGTEETKIAGKGQIKSENKILRNFLIWLGILIFVFVLVFLIINSIKHFEYNGVSFSVIKEGEIIFYNSAFPMYSPITGKHVADYNVYLRNDPRKLEGIPFEGEVKLAETLVLNSTGFNCDGDGIISVMNFVQIFDALGIKVVKDSNATCDVQGRYMFIKLQPGNVTGIEQFGPACYNFNINNCEILKVTERFIVETLIEINKIKES